jgi:hypothetical protein
MEIRALFLSNMKLKHSLIPKVLPSRVRISTRLTDISPCFRVVVLNAFYLLGCVSEKCLLSNKSPESKEREREEKVGGSVRHYI